VCAGRRPTKRRLLQWWVVIASTPLRLLPTPSLTPLRLVPVLFRAGVIWFQQHPVDRARRERLMVCFEFVIPPNDHIQWLDGPREQRLGPPCAGPHEVLACLTAALPEDRALACVSAKKLLGCLRIFDTCTEMVSRNGTSDIELREQSTVSAC
jgi:hypothetical protein